MSVACAEIGNGRFTALVLTRQLWFLLPVLRIGFVLEKKEFNKKKLQFSEVEFILDLELER